MSPIRHDYPDLAALAEGVAGELHAGCGSAIRARGTARLALAGGGTPLPAYRRLAAMPLDWSRVTAVPGDERCVPHDHPACNFRQLGAVLDGAPALQLLPLTPSDGDPDAAQAHANAVLSRCSSPFDATVLGMGLDAHTASLFPGASGLAAALDPYAPMDAVRIDPDPLPPEAPYPRITLTAARLLRTRAVHLVVAGHAKRELLQRALRADDRSRYPVAALLHAADAPVHVHWSPQ